MDNGLRELAKMSRLIERQMLNDQFDRKLWESMHKRWQDWILHEPISPDIKKAFDIEMSKHGRHATFVFDEFSENLE